MAWGPKERVDIMSWQMHSNLHQVLRVLALFFWFLLSRKDEHALPASLLISRRSRHQAMAAAVSSADDV